MTLPSREVDIVGLIASLPGFAACVVVWRYAKKNRALIRKVDRIVNEHERVLAGMEGRPPNFIDVPEEE